jgi:hypothetical protein
VPSFAAKLVPGADLIPFWTMAVANAYRKWKQVTVNAQQSGEQRPALPKPLNFS